MKGVSPPSFEFTCIWRTDPAEASGDSKPQKLVLKPGDSAGSSEVPNALAEMAYPLRHATWAHTHTSKRCQREGPSLLSLKKRRLCCASTGNQGLVLPFSSSGLPGASVSLPPLALARSPAVWSLHSILLARLSLLFGSRRGPADPLTLPFFSRK